MTFSLIWCVYVRCVCAREHVLPRIQSHSPTSKWESGHTLDFTYDKASRTPSSWGNGRCHVVEGIVWFLDWEVNKHCQRTTIDHSTSPNHTAQNRCHHHEGINRYNCIITYLISFSLHLPGGRGYCSVC